MGRRRPSCEAAPRKPLRQQAACTPDPEEGHSRFLVSLLGEADAVVLVAEQGGDVIGHVYAGLEPMSWKELRAACGFIHEVYVDAAARGAGAGEHLCRAAIAWLEEMGASRVLLWSAAPNAAALLLERARPFAGVLRGEHRDRYLVFDGERLIERLAAGAQHSLVDLLHQGTSGMKGREGHRVICRSFSANPCAPSRFIASSPNAW